eukprot:9502044-Pyramimonas_sp.AAC.1
MLRGLHRKDTETWEEFRDRSTTNSREMFREGGSKTLVEKVARYNFEYAVEVSQYKCLVPSTVYSKSWQQTLRVMLHVSGEWTAQRDAVLAAAAQAVSMEGRRRLRGIPRIVAGSWHAPFEKWRSLLWYETCVDLTAWEEFVGHISQ